MVMWKQGRLRKWGAQAGSKLALPCKVRRYSGVLRCAPANPAPAKEEVRTQYSGVGSEEISQNAVWL